MFAKNLGLPIGSGKRFGWGLLGAAILGVAPSAYGQVRISQLYGGGGNVGASLNADYVELYNAGGATVDFSVTNYQISYASDSGTSWTSKTINTGSIGAGKYYLIRLATAPGTVGIPLPTADFVPATALDISATAGKLALYSAVV